MSFHPEPLFNHEPGQNFCINADLEQFPARGTLNFKAEVKSSKEPSCVLRGPAIKSALLNLSLHDFCFLT